VEKMVDSFEINSTGNITRVTDEKVHKEFVNFNSLGHGVKITYPFDWIKSERKPDSVIALYSPLENTSDTHSENFIVQNSDFPIKNMTLDEYTASNLDQLKAFAADSDLDIIELNSTLKLAGSPAFKIVYTIREGDHYFKTMQIWTEKNDKFYNITFNSELAQYERYLPIVRKIIDSLEINPDKIPSLAAVKEYAFDKINRDRIEHGLLPVGISLNEAAQIHARDAFNARQMSHLTTDGRTPYIMYAEANGFGAVSQNIAVDGASNDYHLIDPFKSIDLLQRGMMYNDGDVGWSHRYNILDEYHTNVSLGIAYDNYFFVMVQNFENNYLRLDEPITLDDKLIHLSGILLNDSYIIPENGIQIFYDENLPNQLSYNKHKDSRRLDFGDLVAIVTDTSNQRGHNSAYYEQMPNLNFIRANTWNENKGTFDIEFNITSTYTRPGVYTIVMFLQSPSKILFPATSYPIVVQ
jgi:uncharacterized protein YkwD